MAQAILVVEDDNTIRELVEMILLHAGYQVATARDGREGLELLRRSRPDLVLLDIAMPGIDGLEVLKRIRQRGYSMAVLMMTANSSAQVVRDVMALGGNGYVLKPFDPEELVTRVKKALLP